MNRITPIRLPAEPGCVPISEEHWNQYIGCGGDLRGELITVGPWHRPLRYVAPAVAYEWGPYSAVISVTLYGLRTLTGLREASYHLEGRVSVSGAKRRGLTSSQLFRLPDGSLRDVGVIHVCQA